ncbi:MAG: hypothetical protein J6A73_08695 [Lachnospiraceae bacterium]|nr:hypothetical protein [Lachnospiraceae bacterium]
MKRKQFKKYARASKKRFVAKSPLKYFCSVFLLKIAMKPKMEYYKGSQKGNVGAIKWLEKSNKMN